MTSLPWVGFVGRAYSGKDTAFRAIEPFGYRRVGFADKVRECALALDPLIEVPGGSSGLLGLRVMRLSRVVELVGWDDAKKVPEVRRTLQRVGTEMGREVIDPDLWVNLALAEANRHHPAPVAFTDVRFENEVAMVRAASGVIIGVRRNTGGIEGENAQHSSETGAMWLACDHYIDNDSTIEVLGQRVRAVLGLGEVQAA